MKNKLYLHILMLLLLYPLSNNVYAQLNADLITNPLKKKANAVIRYDRTKVIVEKNKITIDKEFAATALNKKGLGYLQFAESYKDGSSKIKDIKIAIIDKNGNKIRDVNKKEIKDYASYDGYSMITDRRQKNFKFESNQFPVSIEYSFTEESKNTLSVPYWIAIPGYGVSVEQSSIAFTSKVEQLQMNVLENNFNDFSITQHSQYHYEAIDLPAISKENYCIDFLSITPYVKFTPASFTYEGYQGGYKDWDEYGSWVYDKLLINRNNLNKSVVKAELDVIVGSETNPELIAKKIYDYVQETTRYISIALDEGGIQPMKSQDVHEHKYGDCKALSFYMKSLLELYDIQSNYVEIYADSDIPRSYDSTYPSMREGNHIILNIPLDKDTAWVDCTSNDLPFNYLGTFTDDRTGLIISKNGGEIVKTPSYNEATNLRTYDVKSIIKENASIVSDITLNSYGMFMNGRLHLANKSDNEQLDYYQDNFLSSFQNIEINDFEYLLDEEKLQSTEKIKINANHYAERAGKHLLIPIKFKSIKIPRLKKSSHRKYPIFFPRSYRETSKQVLDIPDLYKPNVNGIDFSIDDKFGNYSVTANILVTGELEIIRDFTLFKGEYPPESYSEIKKFFDIILKKESQQIITTKL